MTLDVALATVFAADRLDAAFDNAVFAVGHFVGAGFDGFAFDGAGFADPAFAGAAFADTGFNGLSAANS